MQKVIGTITLFLVMVLIIPVSKSSATTFTVTANPCWTDTGITVLATDTVIFANATANWGAGIPGDPFGPGGLYSGNPSDQWIGTGYQGELIGFIGNSSLDLNTYPRVIFQNDIGLFEIGATILPVTISGLSGKLWLGFNDAYWSNPYDNFGTASVDVTTVPLPTTLLLLGSGLLRLANYRRRKLASRS
jgi:hypothetical protein